MTLRPKQPYYEALVTTHYQQAIKHSMSDHHETHQAAIPKLMRKRTQEIANGHNIPFI